MIQEKSWNQFSQTGLLLVINQVLHIFGWAIVVRTDENGTTAFPARVKFRGFDNESVSENYIKLAEYMDENSKELLKEAKEE